MMKRNGLYFAAFLMIATMVGCQKQEMVVNPDYQDWANVGVGSSVTFEGTMLTDGERSPMRLTETLVSKTPDEMVIRWVIERTDISTTQPYKTPPQKVIKRKTPAMIDPLANPRTHPDSKVVFLGEDTYQIGDQKYDCQIHETVLQRGRGQIDLEEMGVIRIRRWDTPNIPGRCVKKTIEFNAGSGEQMIIDGKAVTVEKKTL